MPVVRCYALMLLKLNAGAFGFVYCSTKAKTLDTGLRRHDEFRGSLVISVFNGSASTALENLMTEKITYKDAGVDVEKADRTVGAITKHVRSTFRPEVIDQFGGFAAMFRPKLSGLADPVLVSATDGVGTKLKIAFMTGIHDTVGIDLVAMNVNDLLVTGAEPLFFLDYFATGKLDENIATQVIAGIAKGCRQAGAALIGGETAEMPDFYAPGEYDLAGFCVGIVDGKKAIDGSKIAAGDVIIGASSTGLHSNGFSLVRKVLLEKKGYRLGDRVSDLGRTLGEELLAPTQIYVRAILDLLDKIEIKGMAHITGGGFTGNIPRILPADCAAFIRKSTWTIPPIFEILRTEASLDDSDMFETFNMGIGFVIIVRPEDAAIVRETLLSHEIENRPIGEIVARKSGQHVIISSD
jgi:phosphoribosylformylglycinamidine cyclo-ligase